MLSLKDINEVSFRKSNFSGYNSDDVDRFIDEVIETVTALAKENAEMKSHKDDYSPKVAELTAKNVELQKKLSILAAKIESYRADEDGIKEAILSAQRLGNASLREARAKAETIVSDANAKAEAILAEARMKSESMVEMYKVQIAEKENELTEMKREVTAFRSSLYEIYREHFAIIERIPKYDIPEEPKVEEAPKFQPAPVKETPAPVVKAEPEEEVIPVPAAQIQEKPAAPAAQYTPAQPAAPYVPTPVQQPVVKQPVAQPQPYTPAQPAAPAYNKDAYMQEQFNGIGLDLNAYSDIPETLQKEKESLFSTLEFGFEDTSKKKGKFKRR
ncbi:MAG: DivIVA domain-containing protein [Clostridia bacterium]|nr:DivIVA domain-containing protein [Clostridia bacterium]